MTTSPTQHRRIRGGRLAGGIGVAAVAATTGGLLLADAAGPGTAPAAADPGLRAFGSCQAVDDWYTENLLPHVTSWGVDIGGHGGPVPLAADAGTARATAESAPAEAGESPAVGVGGTGTNLQEAGVDEPDVAKTASGRLYTVAGGDLVVLDVTGPAPVELGRVRLPGPAQGAEAELLLVADRVVVLSGAWLDVPFPHGTAPSWSDPAGAEPMIAPAGAPTTITTVVDVSIPAAPKVVHTDEIEGRYLSARLTGTAVRVVTTSTPRFGFPSAGPDAGTSLIEQNRRHLRELTAADFLPGTVVTGPDGARTVRPRTDCGAVTRPREWSGAGVITVRTLDPAAHRVLVDEDLVVADGDLVYASTDRLYVGTVKAGWNTWHSDPGSTELHGFDTSAAGATGYLASGQVPGMVPGRWALSARDGRLRVASTRQEHRTLTRGWVPSESGVTVLQEQGTDLVPVGQVTGLGVDEQIHAVRWFDDTVYIVTFRQIDPLYAVDLSDPTLPRVTGELEIPGFSSYLHPLGGHRLLGVGQDADPATGRAGAAQVSLFDVSDPAAPSRVGLWQDTGGTWGSRSMAADDSRQFSYLPDERTALIPLTGEGTSLVALRVDGTGLTLTGRLDLDGWVSRDGRRLRRAISLGDDRVVIITEGVGRTLTTARASTLEPSGSLTLPQP